MSHTPTPPTPTTANDPYRALLAAGWQPSEVQRILTALRRAKVAVIPLPEPNDPDPELCGWLDDTVTTVPGCGKVRVYLDDPRHTSDDAHDLAAAILAAVQIADQDEAR